jgi:hypothetical protein
MGPFSSPPPTSSMTQKETADYWPRAQFPAPGEQRHRLVSHPSKRLGGFRTDQSRDKLHWCQNKKSAARKCERLHSARHKAPRGTLIPSKQFSCSFSPRRRISLENRDETPDEHLALPLGN